MLASRRIVLALVGVFLIGSLVGGLLAMNLFDVPFSNFLNRTNEPTALAARISQRLDHDYHLTPEQKSKIEPLSKDMADQLYQLRRQYGSEVLSTFDSFHQKIGEQLTPDQRADYEKLNEARKIKARRMLMPDSATTVGGGAK